MPRILWRWFKRVSSSRTDGGSLFWQEKDRQFTNCWSLGDARKICQSTTFDDISAIHHRIQSSQRLVSGHPTEFLWLYLVPMHTTNLDFFQRLGTMGAL